MFRVFVRKRKRRLSSPRTIALSVGAHLVLLGVIAAVSTAAPVPTPPKERIITEFPLDPPAPPELIGKPPVVEQPVEPRAAAAAAGEMIELRAPNPVPTHDFEVDPNALPITPDQLSGLGRVGDVIGPPAPATAASTGGATQGDPGPPMYDGYEDGPLERTPELSNAREVARMFDRNYPAVLAEAGIAGQVMLQLVVEADGRVRPGSVRVISATHEEFSAATLRIVERFRFRPATIDNRPVAVMVTIPVDWKPQR